MSNSVKVFVTGAVHMAGVSQKGAGDKYDFATVTYLVPASGSTTSGSTSGDISSTTSSGSTSGSTSGLYRCQFLFVFIFTCWQSN
jgi:hypothetical protein